jgi:hypothetical protein
VDHFLHPQSIIAVDNDHFTAGNQLAVQQQIDRFL